MVRAAAIALLGVMLRQGLVRQMDTTQRSTAAAAQSERGPSLISQESMRRSGRLCIIDRGEDFWVLFVFHFFLYQCMSYFFFQGRAYRFRSFESIFSESEPTQALKGFGDCAARDCLTKTFAGEPGRRGAAAVGPRGGQHAARSHRGVQAANGRGQQERRVHPDQALGWTVHGLHVRGINAYY